MSDSGVEKGEKVKGFWKDLTAKQKKELLTRLFSVVLSGLMVVVIGVISLAWFATNNTVSQREMQVAVSDDAVDILIERTTRYDSGYDGIDGLKGALNTANYSTTSTSTENSPLLAYELVPDDDSYTTVDGVRKYYLQPGAFGTVTFYLKPKKAGATVNFSLERGGLAADYSKVTNTNVTNLLKGHILLFENKTGVNYSRLITGDTFSYTMDSPNAKCSGAEGEETITIKNDSGVTLGTCLKNECYKVVLYWIWPETYYDIIDNISTPALAKKYPSEMTDYLANGTYFFKGTYDANDNDSKSDAYNDGDQTIGDAMDYFVLYIKLL